MSTRIESDWLIADASELPFNVEGKIFSIKVFGIWPRIEIKGKPNDWNPPIKQIVSLIDIEFNNRSRNDDLYMRPELTIQSSSGQTHNLLNGLDDKTPKKYVYFDDKAFGQEWVSPMVKKRAKIAFTPCKNGEHISALHFRVNEMGVDEYSFEINFDSSISGKVSKSKSRSNYSDEKFYIDKINQIKDEEIRGNAFRIFLAGKKTNKDSDIIIEQIIDYLKKNNQLSDDIIHYFDKIKEEQVVDEIIYQRESIPTRIKDQIWRRDQGQCVECGSNEKLEFDHIIPISKGGANSYRNIQLLCEPCNRRKSANIG